MTLSVEIAPRATEISTKPTTAITRPTQSVPPVLLITSATEYMQGHARNAIRNGQAWCGSAMQPLIAYAMFVTERFVLKASTNPNAI